jgi:hypothetical protein
MRCRTTLSFFLPLMAASALLFSSATSFALPIPPGGVQFPASPEAEPVNANLVFSTGPVSFSSATLAGILRSSVWNNDLSNPFGANALTFTYELSAGPTSAHDIARLSVSNFDNFLTDASYNPASGVPPTVITRSADGQVMGFSFINFALDAGQSASTLIVQTNATAFQQTIASLIDGTTASAVSVAPRAVPEPSSLVLAALGMGLAMIGIRRARKA